MANELLAALWETIYMVALSTLFSGIFGFGIAIIMILTGSKGLRPNKAVYTFLDVAVNLLRSFPFIILMIAIIPLTRLIAGTSIGCTASIVPLTIAATPFVARIMEGSLLEVDPGVIEAARSMGASNLQIVFRVMLVEARTSLISGATIVTGTILGYSAMAGTVGGGGLGDIAVRYGYNRWQTDIMLVTVILLVVLVQIFQTIGMLIANKLDKRK